MNYTMVTGGLAQMLHLNASHTWMLVFFADPCHLLPLQNVLATHPSPHNYATLPPHIFCHPTHVSMEKYR